jgi:hypothetical protein
MKLKDWWDLIYWYAISNILCSHDQYVGYSTSIVYYDVCFKETNIGFSLLTILPTRGLYNCVWVLKDLL